MGCFADKLYSYDINSEQINYPGMTVEYCIGYCSLKNYTVAGLQTGYMNKFKFYVQLFGIVNVHISIVIPEDDFLTPI